MYFDFISGMYFSWVKRLCTLTNFEVDSLSRLPDIECFFLLFLFLLDCAIDLGIISNEDSAKMVHGEVDNDDEFAIKTVLELMNLLANMGTIRKGATESALKFLLTNSTTRKSDFDKVGSFRKRSRFTIEDEKEGEGSGGPKECKKIKTTVFDKTCTKESNVITSQVTLDNKFELEDFFLFLRKG